MDAATEHEWVKDNLLIEGLRDWIHLSELHQQFFPQSGAERPLHEVQQLTLNMIRELVSEGLFVLGPPPGLSAIHALSRGICRSMPPWPRSKMPTLPISMTGGAGSPCVG
jgi:hypothetical protein